MSDYARNASTQGEAFGQTVPDIDSEFNALMAERDALRAERDVTIEVYEARLTALRAERDELQGRLEVADGGQAAMDDVVALRAEVEERKNDVKLLAAANGEWVTVTAGLRAEVEELRNDLRLAAHANKGWVAEVERLREALEVVGGLRDPYIPDEELPAFARTALEPTSSNDTQEGT